MVIARVCADKVWDDIVNILAVIGESVVMQVCCLVLTVLLSFLLFNYQMEYSGILWFWSFSHCFSLFVYAGSTFWELCWWTACLLAL